MVTTKDIAKHLNLSQATVSRALNNKGRLSSKTREKILQTAQMLGYTPNIAARMLVSRKQTRIAVILFSEPEYFWNKVREGVEQAAGEVMSTGIAVDVFVTPIEQPEEQLRLMKQLPKDGYDAICLAPSDPSLMADSIDKAIDQGVFVMVVDADISMSKRICYMGCNYTQAGLLAGELMGKMLRGSGIVGMIAFAGDIQPIQQRITGFRTAMDHHPGIALQGPYKFMRNGQDAYQRTHELIDQTAFDGLFVSYGVLDEVARAVSDAGQSGICVIGYDLSDTIASYVRDNTISAAITHEPMLTGYNAVRMMVRFITGQSTNPPTNSINYTKLEIVCRENLEYYI